MPFVPEGFSSLFPSENATIYKVHYASQMSPHTQIKLWSQLNTSRVSSKSRSLQHTSTTTTTPFHGGLEALPPHPILVPPPETSLRLLLPPPESLSPPEAGDPNSVSPETMRDGLRSHGGQEAERRPAGESTGDNPR